MNMIEILERFDEFNIEEKKNIVAMVKDLSIVLQSSVARPGAYMERIRQATIHSLQEMYGELDKDYNWTWRNVR